MDAPEALEALEFYVGLKQFAPPGTVSYSWDEALAVFQNGQIAMAIMWSDSITGVEDPSSSKVSGKIGYTMNPTKGPSGQPASVFGGWAFFVNARSSNAKEAVRFIQWANRADVQVAWAKAGGFPASLSAYDSPQLASVPGLQAHREALNHLVAWTRAPFSARLVEIGQNHLAQAAAGDIEPEQALEAIADRYRQIVAENSQ